MSSSPPRITVISSSAYNQRHLDLLQNALLELPLNLLALVICT